MFFAIPFPNRIPLLPLSTRSPTSKIDSATALRRRGRGVGNRCAVTLSDFPFRLFIIPFVLTMDCLTLSPSHMLHGQATNVLLDRVILVVGCSCALIVVR